MADQPSGKSTAEIPPSNAPQNILADDLLIGASSIAEFTGWKRRRVFYLIEKGGLPYFKIGGVVHARKSTLLRWISRMEEETLEQS